MSILGLLLIAFGLLIGRAAIRSGRNFFEDARDQEADGPDSRVARLANDLLHEAGNAR